ncbi:MAG: hypothetical protein IT285_08205 [Bdellovibrionales bacterium]|nr:hypothetical protein [Bdellovibrionales bacterium]
MRVNRLLTNLGSPELFRRTPAADRAMRMHAEGIRDPHTLARLAGPSLDLFHDPTLGMFDKYMEATRQMVADPAPMHAIHTLIV